MTGTVVKAGPTKRFFVSMLTRDIDLKDAVLDLLDNCMDGVMRSLKNSPPKDNEKPYDGYWARISVNKDSFTIDDNCGGIPREIAIESAFRLGRPNERDDDLHTIGMYGIGMKRAIFKIGKAATVYSTTNTDSYKVDITTKWLSEEDNWSLSLEESERLKQSGTKISIEPLYDYISTQFDDQRAAFIKELRDDISQLYTIIISKGFSVTLNGEKVQPRDIRILLPKHLDATSIHPYMFKGVINDVDVLVVVGFFRPPPSVDRVLDEDDEEQEYARSDLDQAGWNIVCNDRLVLHTDRSAITGWGTRNIPRYHTQFSSIGGTVIFSSKISDNLPLRTTKRGLNTSSDVYMVVLDYMVEGLRKFIDFTNKWKGQVEQAKDFFIETDTKLPSEAALSIPQEKWTEVKKAAPYGQGFKFSPKLKLPDESNPIKKIVFLRPSEDVKAVAQLLFDDPDAKPRDVGERCFDIQLKRAKDE